MGALLIDSTLALLFPGLLLFGGLHTFRSAAGRKVRAAFGIALIGLGGIGLAGTAVSLTAEWRTFNTPPSVTPQGNTITDDGLQELLQLAQSGTPYRQPEGSKIAAIATNWEAALGYSPTSDDLSWLKSVAGSLEDALVEGSGCEYVDEATAFVAEELNTDQGRAGYILGSATLSWVRPEQEMIILRCSS